MMEIWSNLVLWAEDKPCKDEVFRIGLTTLEGQELIKELRFVQADSNPYANGIFYD